MNNRNSVKIIIVIHENALEFNLGEVSAILFLRKHCDISMP